MITGCILAGGQSRRMGRDKALLPVGSQTLIEIVIERMRPLVEQVVVIGHPSNVRQLEERLAHKVLTDLTPGRGPLMGVYTGLMQTETALNLFVPCDMPWVDGRLIERLVPCCREDVPVVASRHPVEGIQPFPLICHVTACRSIGALLDRQEQSVQALLRGPHTQVITIEEPGLWPSFTNVNTLSDYAKLDDATTLTHRS